MDTLNGRKLMFSNRDIAALAVPIILENLLSIAAGMADSVMVSSAGEAAVSGVSLVDSINLLFVAAFFALTTGGSVVTAQYIGRKDLDSACDSAKQILFSSALLAAAFMAILLCIVPQTLRLLFGTIDADVFDAAEKYFYWTLIGYPFLAIGNTNCALFRTMARSRVSLVLATGANILNVIGNAILIFGFNLGAEGAAISTTFSRVVWAVVSTLMLRNPDLPVHFENLRRFRFNVPMLKKILGIGVPNAIENGLFQIGKILVSSLVSSFGTVMIAANSVVYSISCIGWNPLGGFSTVLLTVVGQCMGANDPEQARYYFKKVVKIASVFMIILFGAMFLLREPLVSIYDLTPETHDAAVFYTAVSAIATIASVYSFSFVPTAGFRAAGDTKFAVILAVTSMFVFRVGSSYILGKFLGFGLLGVWIGMGLDWLCRTVFNFIRFKSGKWLTKKVI